MGPAAPKQFQRAVAYGAGAVHSEDFRQRQVLSAPFLAILVLCPETGKIKGNLPFVKSKCTKKQKYFL